MQDKKKNAVNSGHLLAWQRTKAAQAKNLKLWIMMQNMRQYRAFLLKLYKKEASEQWFKLRSSKDKLWNSLNPIIMGGGHLKTNLCFLDLSGQIWWSL